nr:homeobox protein ceh-5-like [Halyomorpha halys]
MARPFSHFIMFLSLICLSFLSLLFISLWPRKKETKRRTSKTPRIPFSLGQLKALEERFQISPYLNSEDAAYLSSFLHLSEQRVKVWFQNRRARERRLKGEELPVSDESEQSSETNTGTWSAFRAICSFIENISSKSVHKIHQDDNLLKTSY